MAHHPTLTESIRRYVSLQWAYYRLSFVEKLATVIGIVMLLTGMAILALVLILLFAFFGYSALVSLTGSGWTAAGIEIAAVVLLMGLLWTFRDRLVIQPVGNLIVRALFDTPENPKHNDHGNL